MTNYTIGIDCGLEGAIAVLASNSDNSTLYVDSYSMPTHRVLVEPAKTKFKDPNPKVVYKTGSRKGERPRIITRAAKYKREIDVYTLMTLVTDICQNYNVQCIGVEEQFVKFGNNGKTNYMNFGAVLAIANIIGVDNKLRIHRIHPATWKTHAGLTQKGKQSSIDLVQHLYSVKVSSHDIAEAILIARYANLVHTGVIKK